MTRIPPLPLLGADNPSSVRAGTNPGSFAQAAQVGSALSYSSPDTKGMPAPSDKTAWDFMPADWRFSDGTWHPPQGFVPITQLEHARLGIITSEMRRVAEREPHLLRQGAGFYYFNNQEWHWWRASLDSTSQTQAKAYLQVLYEDFLGK